jgi:hypothetical protein
MSIEITASVDKTSITLGQAVTLTYSCTGAQNVQLSADCLSEPFNLGDGDQSGTIKLLPVMSGVFNIEVAGYGNAGMGSDSTSSLQKALRVTVN